MLGNLILETTNAPGTSADCLLLGPVAGRLPFGFWFPSGSQCFYVLNDGSQQEWGVGTFTTGSPNILSRTTVIRNSAGSTARLNFMGMTRIYNDVPSERSLWVDNSNNVNFPAGVSVTSVHVYNTAGAIIGLHDNDASLDQKVFDFVSQDGAFYGRVVNDVYNAANNWLSVTRSGYVIGTITLAGTQINLNAPVAVGGSLSCHNAFTVMGDTGQEATAWLNPASGKAAQIISSRPGKILWQMQLGNSSATDDFQLHRHNDSDVYVDAPLTISRATAAVTLTGGLSAPGVNSTGNIGAAGRVTANDMMCATGTFYIGGNTAYYLARNATDNNWRFVENNVTNFTVAPNGDVSARASVFGTYMQSSGAVWAGTSMRVFGVGTNWSYWGNTTDYIGWSWNSTNLDVYVNYTFVGNSPSDERLKNIIGPYERGLAELRKIDPVLYRLKGNDRGVVPHDQPDAATTQQELNDGPSIRDTEKVHVGFVAQKVEGGFPELVKRRPAVVDGKIVDDVRYVDEGPWLTFAVVNAIKEMDARLTALTEANAALTARVMALEAKGTTA